MNMPTQSIILIKIIFKTNNTILGSFYKICLTRVSVILYLKTNFRKKSKFLKLFVPTLILQIFKAIHSTECL